MRTTSKARKAGYRSGSEQRVAMNLALRKVRFEYEPKAKRIEYTVPEKTHKYLVDFILPNGIHIECKGLFSAADRKKHLLIQKQHPDLDLRFLFDNARRRLSKTSKTMYKDWCDKHNFIWAERTIPQQWLDEKPAEQQSTFSEDRKQ